MIYLAQRFVPRLHLQSAFLKKIVVIWGVNPEFFKGNPYGDNSTIPNSFEIMVSYVFYFLDGRDNDWT